MEVANENYRLKERRTFYLGRFLNALEFRIQVFCMILVSLYIHTVVLLTRNDRRTMLRIRVHLSYHERILRFYNYCKSLFLLTHCSVVIC